MTDLKRCQCSIVRRAGRNSGGPDKLRKSPKRRIAPAPGLRYHDYSAHREASEARALPISPNWVYKRLYDGVNYRLRTFAGGRFASKCRPTSIVILLTELCNARCVHCDIWKNKGKEDSPTPEQWKKVLSDLRAWLGPVHVVFSGGEALLRPYATDLVAHGSSIGLFIEILTHGYWDDQSKIEKLALAKPWRVTV